MAVMEKMLKKSTKGFTLSELLLVVGIMALVFSAIILMLISCFLLNEANRNLTIATTHAQHVMEEIKDSASTVAGFDGLTTQIAAGAWDFTTQFAAGVWNWTSATINTQDLTALPSEAITTTASGTADKVAVNVMVSWQDRRRSRNMSLETLIAEP